VPIKRVNLLLNATARAAGSASLRLVVVGEGEIRPRLRELSERLGIADRVRFLGYRRDLARIAAATTSPCSAGTPVSLIEAAAAGLPAVALSSRCRRNP
jgi:glycosyltransferase involved in cell wall biosynthesis